MSKPQGVPANTVCLDIPVQATGSVIEKYPQNYENHSPATQPYKQRAMLCFVVEHLQPHSVCLALDATLLLPP